MWTKMEIERCLKLTLAVYRVTELFPENEPLKFQIRESANRILADLLCDENGSRHILEIKGLFDLAQNQNLVDSRNFLVLSAEYDKIENTGKTVENSFPKNNLRQEKILEVINGNGKIKIGNLIGLFPEINRRTVLRDLEGLCQTGVVVRNGNGRGIYYTR